MTTMLSYEELDRIADSYTPLLAALSLLFIAAALYRRQWQVLGMRLAGWLGVVLFAYGFMFLDNALKIWTAVGLDYSTHTAVAFALVVFLSANIRKLRWMWCGSFLSYLLLMLYQKYHTVADIVSTLVVVGAPIIYVSLTFARMEKRRFSVATAAN
jgi:hypothetical protein